MYCNQNTSKSFGHSSSFNSFSLFLAWSTIYITCGKQIKLQSLTHSKHCPLLETRSPDAALQQKTFQQSANQIGTMCPWSYAGKVCLEFSINRRQSDQKNKPRTIPPLPHSLW